MGYSDYDDAEPAGSRTTLTVLHGATSLMVRLAGLALLSVGLWAGVSVILEAWSLYKDPLRIERFASAIEEGSNLDRLFAAEWPDAPTSTNATPGYAPESSAEGTIVPTPRTPAPGGNDEVASSATGAGEPVLAGWLSLPGSGFFNANSCFFFSMKAF